MCIRDRYYIDSNQKAPAWTGVPYFYNFLTRQGRSLGPMGRDSTMEEIRPGDIIQLSFSGEAFQHSPVVVSVGDPITPVSYTHLHHPTHSSSLLCGTSVRKWCGSTVYSRNAGACGYLLHANLHPCDQTAAERCLSKSTSAGMKSTGCD